MSAPDHNRPSRETPRYAEYMKTFYDNAIASLDDAKAVVAGDGYDTAQSFARATADYILGERTRRGFAKPADQLSVLEIGCGVGRMMGGFRRQGVRSIDGVDISDKMLAYAAQDAELEGSRFFLSSGEDLGNAPRNHYDLIYSTLVFQHLCNRFLRMKLLEHAYHCLNDYGVIVIQLHYYPQVRRETIPSGHAHWTDYQVSTQTSSMADVFLTPDALPDAVQDFKAFFADVGFTFVEFPNAADIAREHPNYGGCLWDHVFITASKTPNLHRVVYRGE